MNVREGFTRKKKRLGSSGKRIKGNNISTIDIYGKSLYTNQRIKRKYCND